MKVFVNVVDMNLRTVIRMLQYSFERHCISYDNHSTMLQIEKKKNLQNISSETKGQTSFL